MALHKKREEANPAAARLVLEATEPVELPAAEIDDECVSYEKTVSDQHLSELLDALRSGGIVTPAPLVDSQTIFIVNGVTRSFWVRLWHTDASRTRIARAHVLNCLPKTPRISVNFGLLR